MPNVPDVQLDKCPGHKAAIPVFVAGPVTIYAGAGMSQTPCPAGGVVFDLAGMLKPVVWATGFDIPGLACKYVRIEWADRGVPDLTADDWQAIARAIVAAGIPVMVACAGGHGRTGTALAVLGHYLDAYPTKDYDPIDYLRRVYCPEAVESPKQVSYVKEMTGRETTCKPSDATPHKSGGKGSVVSYGTLCPERVNGHFCNLDTGHSGPHDTRSRSEIETAGAVKPLDVSTWSKPNKPKTTSPTGAILFCPEPLCMARAGHAGPHLDVNNQPLTLGG